MTDQVGPKRLQIIEIVQTAQLSRERSIQLIRKLIQLNIQAARVRAAHEVFSTSRRKRLIPA
jgi:hypothetical protein